MKHLFIKHGYNLVRLLLIAAFAFTVFTIISVQKSNREILIHIKQQQDAGDQQRKDLSQAVIDLKNDNAQQTVILCTLILSQEVQVTGDDVPKIEAICKEKIKQNDVPLSDTSISQALQAPQASSDGEPPPGTTSNPIPPQTAPEQPTQPQPVTIPTPVGVISLCLPFTSVCVMK